MNIGVAGTGRGCAAVAVVAALAIGGCGSDGGQTSSTSPESRPESTSTTQPMTFAEAVRARLTKELGDRDVATAVVDQLGPDALASLEVKSGGDAAGTPLLRYRPPTRVPEQLDGLVIFAFGNRVAADGTATPGPVNEAMADAVATFVADHPMPVYAQWEVGDLLTARSVPGVVSIRPQTGPDGTEVYLSTAGVAEQVVAAAPAGEGRGRVGVVCFRDHAVRCLQTAAAAGMEDPAVPKGLRLPADYDAESGQSWTRDRMSYIVTDLTARLAS